MQVTKEEYNRALKSVEDAHPSRGISPEARSELIEALRLSQSSEEFQSEVNRIREHEAADAYAGELPPLEGGLRTLGNAGARTAQTVHAAAKATAEAVDDAAKATTEAVDKAAKATLVTVDNAAQAVANTYNDVIIARNDMVEAGVNAVSGWINSAAESINGAAEAVEEKWNSGVDSLAEGIKATATVDINRDGKRSRKSE